MVNFIRTKPSAIYPKPGVNIKEMRFLTLELNDPIPHTLSYCSVKSQNFWVVNQIILAKSPTVS